MGVLLSVGGKAVLSSAPEDLVQVHSGLCFIWAALRGCGCAFPGEGAGGQAYLMVVIF